MTFAEVMQILEQAGAAQTRKTYARHGVGANQYGASFAVMRSLAKQIKRDHALALRLWASGNFEARVVATMIADPKAITLADAKALVADLDQRTLTDELAGNLLVKTPFAEALVAALTEPDSAEFAGRAGWHLVAVLAKGGKSTLDFAGLLSRIETEIDAAPNWKREAMHTALMAIGIYCRDLSAAAVAAAERIGKVDIDHGDTACKTPDAAAYMRKALARMDPV